MSETPVLTAEDIEAAYERALEAMDAVEVAVEQLSTSVAEGDDHGGDQADTTDDAEAVEPSWDSSPFQNEPSAPLLHPREIIEAALFVGGQSLTTRRLSQMLGGHETPERVDGHIAELNQIYREQQRPYQIDFGEGGYRLVLLPEFEAVRRSVFGAGPKEVKLSQDALEVLAFVAYRQPVTQDDLEDVGQDKAAGLLRQLLRRELIVLDRSDGTAAYSTSDRFLEVFGLRSLDDLPFPDDLELK